MTELKTIEELFAFPKLFVLSILAETDFAFEAHTVGNVEQFDSSLDFNPVVPGKAFFQSRILLKETIATQRIPGS